ncbi:MAG TPA: hypothetical protein VMV78_01305 [Thiobacillus sp.]|nr:hypothetical protein [Thiobacillus sp.]
MLCRIILAILAWAIITGVAFILIQKFKSERASMIGGAIFLAGAVAAVLLLPVFLGVQAQCTTDQCVQGKEMASALVTLFIISWGAFGANVLSACISHK